MSDNVVEFVVKATDDFSSTMGKLDSGMGLMKTAFIALAAAYPIAKTIELARVSLDNAEAMGIAAQKAGISTEAYTSMAWAAEMSGSSSEALGSSIKFLNKAIAEGNTTEAGKQLIALGISAKDPAVAMEQLAEVFSKSKDGAEKSAIAMTILGRNGASMIPLLNGGSQAMRDMNTEAHQLGQTIGDDFAVSADEINDNLTKMHSIISGSVNKAMADLTPTIETLTTKFVDYLKESDAVNIAAGVFYAAMKTVIVVVMATIDVIGLMATAVKGIATSIKDFGLGIYYTFEAVGKGLVALVEAAGAVNRLDFKGAKEILVTAADSISESWKNAGDSTSKAVDDLTGAYNDAVNQVSNDMTEMTAIIDGSMENSAAATAKAAAQKRSAGEQLSLVDKEAVKNANDLRKAIDDQLKSLSAQTNNFGESTDRIKLYELELRGATIGLDDMEKKQLAQIRTLTRLKEEQDEYSKALAYMKGINPYNQMIQEMDKLERAEKAIGGATAETNKKRKEIAMDYDKARIASQAYMNNEMSIGAKLKDMYNVNQKAMGSFSDQMARGMLQTWDTAAKGIGKATADALVDGQSLAKGLEDVAKMALKTVISMLVEMGIQRMVLAVINAGATTTESALHKGAALGDVYLNSFASAAAIPMVGWALAPNVAMANTAIAASLTPGAIATGMALGAAHGGLDYVPSESTFLLQKGERVLSPNQNSDLNQFMKDGKGGGMSIQSLTIHVLENATNADAFAKMNAIDLRNKLGKPIIDALNEMYKIGVKPASQMKAIR